ncbi:MAG TPA: phage holin family protein [Pseudomonas sp.]|nr:phage holin family protein [Pseudomonas sp.]
MEDHSDTRQETAAAGDGPSVRRIGGALLGLLEGHVELLGLEIKEEKARTLRLVIHAALGLVFGLLLVIGLSSAIVIAAWDDYRMVAILGLCALYAIGLAVCLGKVRSQVRHQERPFHDTLEEMARNRERLLP